MTIQGLRNVKGGTSIHRANDCYSIGESTRNTLVIEDLVIEDLAKKKDGMMTAAITEDRLRSRIQR